MEKRLCLSLMFILMSVSASSSSVVTSMLRFDKQVFEANAELYGNKTANLMELEKIVGYLNQKQSVKNFAVPAYFGISSSEIIAYLQKMPYEQTTVWSYILDQWQRFIAAQPRQEKLLTEDARAALAGIRTAMTSTEFDVTAIVNEQSPVRSAQLKVFLEDAVAKNHLLMVRSTGREDGKELSNAGGNASIASVPPVIGALSKAIQDVLESYSSEKSIGQRLVGKDKHLFDTPFMAVLLQVMMGEVYGASNEIPKSGVMFSPEAEGETQGVVVIQATFGHNEGVVNGLVPVDTYYVGASNIIHPLISIKPKRLAALPGKEGLDFVENDFTLQRTSTLDPETVLALKEAVQFVQNYYDNAVDIEFVILGNTIYFVQARPLEDKVFEASYLNNDFVAHNNKSMLSVIPIGIGNGAVRIIERPAQLIVTDNIRQALDVFLFKTQNQDAVEAIIINEPAPNTSHEATQFRRLGKPVLYVPDLNNVKIWLKDLGASAKTLLIDAQRAILVQFTPNESLKTPEGVIEQGWYAHPIAKKVSLMSDFFPKLSQEHLSKLTLEEFFKGTQTTALIDIIKSGNREQVEQALRSLLHRTWAALQKVQTAQRLLAKTQPQLIAQLKHIFACMLASAYEIIEALKNNNGQRLEMLYPIVFLEALLRQIPEPNRLVNDYSFGSVLKTELQEKNIVQELKLQGSPERMRITQYAKADEKALVPAVKNNFDRYLQSLAAISDSELQDRFAQLMYNLAKLDTTALWLNTSFERAYATQGGDTQKIADLLLAEYTSTADFIAQLQRFQEFFVTFNVSAFEEPAAFAKQRQTLQDNIIAMLTLIDQNIETTTELGKVAALQVMHSAVETFDTSIKALTGSKLYTNDNQKIMRFKDMLNTYVTILQHWARIPSVQSRLSHMLDNSVFGTVEDYVGRIKQGIESLNTSDSQQLQPSTRFNVAGATMGSMAAWNRSAPDPLTLEDAFTLIHQNLLVIQGILAMESGLQDMRVPDTVQALKEAADRIIVVEHAYKSYKANLIGLSFSGRTLTYYYNLPQRNHSSTFQIIYDLQDKKTYLAVQFFGEARARWQIAGDLVYIFAQLNNLQISKAVEIDQARGLLSFGLEIENPQQAFQALSYIEMVANFATQEGMDLLKVFADKNSMPMAALGELILKSIPLHPNLLLVLPMLLEEFGVDHPLVQQGYRLLAEYFSKVEPEAQKDILRTLDTQLLLPGNNQLQNALALIETNRELLFSNIELSDITNRIVSKIIKKMGPIKADEFIKNNFLDSQNLNNQAQGIRFLTYDVPESLVAMSSANDLANDVVTRFISSPSTEVRIEVLYLVSRLLAKQALKNEDEVLQNIQTLVLKDNIILDKLLPYSEINHPERIPDLFTLHEKLIALAISLASHEQLNKFFAYLQWPPAKIASAIATVMASGDSKRQERLLDLAIGTDIYSAYAAHLNKIFNKVLGF